MDVHVPQARDQESAPALDLLPRAPCPGDAGIITNRDNRVTARRDSLVRQGLAKFDIDKGCMADQYVGLLTRSGLNRQHQCRRQDCDAS